MEINPIIFNDEYVIEIRTKIIYNIYYYFKRILKFKF